MRTGQPLNIGQTNECWSSCCGVVKSTATLIDIWWVNHVVSVLNFHQHCGKKTTTGRQMCFSQRQLMMLSKTSASQCDALAYKCTCGNNCHSWWVMHMCKWVNARLVHGALSGNISVGQIYIWLKRDIVYYEDRISVHINPHMHEHKRCREWLCAVAHGTCSIPLYHL